jgi:hypothetical protein
MNAYLKRAERQRPRSRRLGSCCEDVVPVVVSWMETLGGGMEGYHSAHHVLAGEVGVKAAVDGRALVEGRSQPAWIGPGTGRGDAAMVSVESKATDGLDGRFHQDDGWQGLSGNREEAEILGPLTKST